MQFVSLGKFVFAAAIVAASVAAGAESRDVSPEGDQGARGDNFLEIPGIGRIQMPPGVHVFQPRGAHRFGGDEDSPRAEESPGFGPQAKPSPGIAAPPAQTSRSPSHPSPPKSPQQARADALDALFARMKDAADEEEAQAIANRIMSVFASTSSDTVALLSSRAAAAEIAGAQPVAEALLDDVIVLDPAWAEAFVRRARLKATRGDAAGAREDLESALRLEPRRFDALAALGALLEEAGDKKAALETYRRGLALDPRQEKLQKSEDRLRLEVEGRDI
jgi:hypothetical protein